MAEETQTPSTEQSSSSTEQTQSLEDVYKQFNVEAEAQNFRPQRTEQTQQTEKPAVTTAIVPPDPVLDPNGYRAYTAQQQDSVSRALNQVTGQLNQIQSERVVAKAEADIKAAVQTFKSVVGEGVDDDMAEVALGIKAKKDPKFMAVFQNRDKNPQAWRAAVSAYGNEFKSKNVMRVDSQIAENQRAAKASIGSQTKTTNDEPSGDEALFKGKSGAEFERTWRNYVDRGY